MIKKVLFGLMILAVGIGVLAYWLQQDDELSVQSQALIDSDYAFQRGLKQHPFFYIYGIDAKAEIAPETLGRLRYYAQWQPPSTASDSLSSSQIQQLQKQPLSDEQQQRLDELNQVLKQRPEHVEAFIQQHQKQLAALLDSEQFMLQRYLNWLNRTDYVSLLIPVDGVLPDYRTLHYLHLLHMVQVSLKPKAESKAELVQYLSALHTMQEQKLSMVEKHVLQSFMWQSLDVLNAKFQHAKLHITPLSQTILSLRQGMRYEVSLSAQSFQNLAAPKGTAAWQYRLVYLPNRSINQQVEDIEPTIALSELPYLDFLQQYAQVRPKVRSKYVLKNAVGNILAQVAVPDWRPYALRSRILDNKIRVFNAVQQQTALEVLNQNIEGYEYYQKNEQLCLKQPFPQEKLPEYLAQDTCLSI